ncbi:MAG: CPBP family intramembrane metalloprotease [Bacteroides sp.]|nr:CPBP family intramembrane metalloprotease [Bacillota bacterium]MCM1394098.1 CPBP family intramembrane metalloprotease [[Eubacterium] siraeum]MCM1455889.1 CPBP family intramembrane metalloprotease [Bacteroides sp.]
MRKTIGASESSSIYLIAICAGSIMSLFMSLILSKADAEFGGMSVQSWVGYALMQAAFIASVLIYAKARKVDELSIAKIKKPRDFRQLLLTPFIAIATILIFLPLANLWGSFLDLIHFHGAGVAVPNDGNVGVYFLSLLVMAALPAFGEELLMRGNVFHGLSTKSVWFGILMSSLFFSLMHASPYQTVHQFGLGFAMAITLILTGSIWATVLVHFFNNFISITLSNYLPQVDAIYIELGYFNWLTGAASVIAGIVLLVLLFYILHRLGDKNGDFRVVETGIVYDEFTISPILPKETKINPIKGFFKFFASLFTVKGWRSVTRVLNRANDVNCLGKAQPMIGVWIALGLSVIYWLYSFISGLI